MTRKLTVILEPRWVRNVFNNKKKPQWWDFRNPFWQWYFIFRNAAVSRLRIQLEAHFSNAIWYYLHLLMGSSTLDPIWTRPLWLSMLLKNWLLTGLLKTNDLWGLEMVFDKLTLVQPLGFLMKVTCLLFCRLVASGVETTLRVSPTWVWSNM